METPARQPGFASRLVPKSPWRAVLLLTLLVTAIRIAFLILSPYELVADEAQYWDWSRHLDWSYYSKGPGVAWVIAASTALFGDAEWAVRLPAVLAGAVAMLALARLATAMAGGDQRVGLLAAVGFLCVPAYHGTSILMTIDGPYITCWILAAWAGWSAWRTGSLCAWALTGLALGVGFLFKYTIVLLAVGFVLMALTGPKPRRAGWGALVAFVVFGVTSLPVLIWNAQHGWPTVAHLLGHLGVTGGDMQASAARSWSYHPMWTLELIGTQLGMIGPMLAVMWMGWRAARRSDDPHIRDAGRYCLWCGAPILIFYLLVTLLSDAEGNWPIAGYTTLIVPAAILARRELARYRALMRAWKDDPARPRPKRGLLRRKPETPFQIAWHWSVAFGMATFIGLMVVGLLARLPGIGPLIPMGRLSGHRDFALQVQTSAIEPSRGVDAGEAIVIADRYGRAALLAYYLPGQPIVFSATSFLGGRRSSYDYFTATDLRRPDLLGRQTVLIGSTPQRWTTAFDLARVQQVIAPQGRRKAVYLGGAYRGPRDASGAQPSPTP